MSRAEPLVESPAFAEPRAAYLHVPFCAHRCGYCNFTVIAGRDGLIDRYLHALELELSALGQPRAVDTLFIGGGTPTHLPPTALERLLELARHWFTLPAVLPPAACSLRPAASSQPAASSEFSVEANPLDLDATRCRLLRQYGVTRVSLGAQSFRPAKLRQLERDHSPDDIRRGYQLAREHVRDVSLDLIFAAPGETLQQWQAELEGAVALQPDHLSTYGLTYEQGATFFGRRLRGELTELGDDLQRQMYEAAIDRLAAAGFEHYEVSNFARPGKRCRHNETYWLGRAYYAAGPGAARYVGGVRETNHRSTTTWMRRVLAGQSPVAETETLSPADRAREALVLGLRRLEGVDREAFASRTGYDLDELCGPNLERFVALGLLADDGRRIRLTRAGLLVSDSLWPELL